MQVIIEPSLLLRAWLADFNLGRLALLDFIIGMIGALKRVPFQGIWSCWSQSADFVDSFWAFSILQSSLSPSLLRRAL